MVRHICRTSKVVPALRYEVETKLARRSSGGRRAGTAVSDGHPDLGYRYRTIATMSGNANEIFWTGGPPGSRTWRAASAATTPAPAAEEGTTPPRMGGFPYPTSSDESTATAVTMAAPTPELEVEGMQEPPVVGLQCFGP